jgi:hypothetical protein
MDPVWLNSCLRGWSILTKTPNLVREVSFRPTLYLSRKIQEDPSALQVIGSEMHKLTRAARQRYGRHCSGISCRMAADAPKIRQMLHGTACRLPSVSIDLGPMTDPISESRNSVEL